MFRKSMLALLAATAMGVPALAADLPEPIEPAPVPIETSGWYLRGDVGYVFRDKSKGDWNFWNQYPGYEGVDDSYRFDQWKFGNGVSVGGGVGYRFNEFLRTDATLDWFKADVKGTTDCPYMIKNSADHGFLSDPQADDCNYDLKSNADVYLAMANAYVDLPVFGSGIVPYIGAGIGAAYVDYDDGKFKEKCDACVASYVPYEATNGGQDDWRFAASLMAGATVDLTGPLKLDVGYKYTRISGGDVFGYDAADKAAGAKGSQFRDSGFDLHQVRAGLRYEFF